MKLKELLEVLKLSIQPEITIDESSAKVSKLEVVINLGSLNDWYSSIENCLESSEYLDYRVDFYQYSIKCFPYRNGKYTVTIFLDKYNAA